MGSRKREALIRRCEAPGTPAALEFGLRDSPYLTIPEAARFLRFDQTKNAEQNCRDWLHRHAVPITRRGRTLLVERAVLEVILARGR